MTKMRQLILGVVGAGLLAVMPMGEAKGELIGVNPSFSVNSLGAQVGHYEGLTEGFDDGYDVRYPTLDTPVVDFYSHVGNERLLVDCRGIDSVSVFQLILFGNGLTKTEVGILTFTVDDDADLSQRTYFADIFKGGEAVLLNIDVLEYDANNIEIPLSLANGESYAIDIRTVPVPEPSTCVLMGLGVLGLSLGAYRRRTMSRPS
jgi:hypothetical protein